MKSIEVFGLQRSGTSYLQQIIDHNFDARITCKSWKHSLPDETYTFEREFNTLTSYEKIEDGAVLIFKDFDHWIESIKRQPADLFKMRGKNLNLHGFYYKYNFEWIKLISAVRYEDFLEDFEHSVNELGEILKLEPLNYDKPTNVAMSSDWKDNHAKRYL